MSTNTIDLIAHDAANNIVKLAKKIIFGKEPEKNEDNLNRILSLRHEIGLCMEEADFIRSFVRDEDSIESKELANLDKVIKYAKRAAPSKKASEDLIEATDEDYLKDCTKKAQENRYDLCGSQYNDRQKVRWYCPWSLSGEPHNLSNYEHEPLMNEASDKIKDIICLAQKKVGRTLNVMFSRGNYEPKAIGDIKDELGDNVRIYGTYDSPTLLSDRELRLKMNRCAFGAPRDYQVSNNAFDIIYSREISSLSYGYFSGIPSAVESTITKDIKRFWRYLAPGGILLLAVPKFCMRQKERMVASGYYTYVWNEKISCKKYPELDFRLIALRKETTITDEEKDVAYQKLTNMEPSSMPKDAFSSLPKEDRGEIKMIRGPEEDLLIVQIALEKSTLKVKKEEHKKRNIEPLLPLKKGQIAQIIASGRLNGIIDEGDGFKHVISGRVIKGSVRKFKQDFSDPQNAFEETTIRQNNMVQVNALGADGIIRTISMVANG